MDDYRAFEASVSMARMARRTQLLASRRLFFFTETHRVHSSFSCLPEVFHVVALREPLGFAPVQQRPHHGREAAKHLVQAKLVDGAHFYSGATLSK